MDYEDIKEGLIQGRGEDFMAALVEIGHAQLSDALSYAEQELDAVDAQIAKEQQGAEQSDSFQDTLNKSQISGETARRACAADYIFQMLLAEAKEHAKEWLCDTHRVHYAP